MKKRVLYLIMCVFAISAVNAQVVSLIGSGVGGWGTDVDLTTTDNIHYSASQVVIAQSLDNGILKSEVKFRQDHDWANNWGAIDWPKGTGTAGGKNIPAIVGTYDVTFNITTGDYEFIGGAPVPVVKLVGTAVADVAGLSLTTSDLATFTVTNAVLLDGLGQFSIDGTAIVGGTAFPTGTVADATQFIPIPAGKYTSISFNINTGDYSFVAAPVYNTVSIVGSGAAGWGVDTDMKTTDGIHYVLNGITLTGVDPQVNGSGEIKFRQNHDWIDPNFADVAFPSGIATTTGGNIVVTTPGTYIANFNLVTGEYSFTTALISITGDAVGGWGTGFDFDLTTTDGANYTLNTITLSAAGFKFREGHSWDAPHLNWGGSTFPEGPDPLKAGDNIVALAGDYSVTFNFLTGAYSFGAPLATKGFSTSNFKVYPNPSQNNWNFTSANDSIESIQILDVTGKNILTVSPKNTAANVDATNLPQGLYFAKISTAKATETIKLMKN